MVTAAAPRMRRPRWQFTSLAARVAVVTVVGAPILVVASSLWGFETELWSLLWRTTLRRQIITTLALGGVVGIGATLLGAAMAWIVTAYSFPGVRTFRWLLMLTFAMPAYVLAFVGVGLLEYTGPVQSTWRSFFGADAWFPPIRTPVTAAIVMIFAFFPYAYIAALAAYADRARAQSAAARTLGLGPIATWWRVVLPTCRPTLAAAGTLIVMETVTDVGVARTFGVQSLASGMLQAWFGLDQREGAAELAMLLAGAAFLVVALERLARGRARYVQRTAGATPIPPTTLRGRAALACTALAGTISLLSFVGPGATLGVWASRSIRRGGEGALDARFWDVARTSITLAVLVGVVAVAAACILSLSPKSTGTGTGRPRLGRRIRFGGSSGAILDRLSSMGYGLPGLVIAVGTLKVLTTLDGLLDRLAEVSDRLYVPFLLAGSLVGVVYGLTVRFLAVARENVDAGVARIEPRVLDAARSLGARPSGVIRRVQLPLLRRSLVVAGLLVALDTLKELPATLLLRPAGRDTLSVFVWNMTNESRWEEASVSALAIVVVGVPIVLVAKRLVLGRRSPSRRFPA